MNVGPKADGTFPQQSIDLLKEIGEWMKVNGEAIYATKASPLALLSWGRCTKKENSNTTTLYLSVFDWPTAGKLVIRGVKNAIVNAKLLATGKTLSAKNTKDEIVIG